jgi:hypothetical protein
VPIFKLKTLKRPKNQKIFQSKLQVNLNKKNRFECMVQHTGSDHMQNSEIPNQKAI